jgi:two-component system chemotaxis response regulator CheB
MKTDRVVVIGASAGGVRALEDVVGGLPPDFPAPVLIVLHLAAHHRSLLPEILASAGTLRVRPAANGQKLKAGEAYVAIPDHHLLIGDDGVLVTTGPKENHYRPSIDLLFRSAAYHYGNRAIGVVLSGSLSDGSSGLFSIKRLGGIAITQDPDEAPYNSMPLAALKRVDIDYSMPVKEIGRLLDGLVREPAPAEPVGTAAYRATLKEEVDLSAGVSPLTLDPIERHEPSGYTCPDCHGVLTRIKEGKQDRFRCHTGHGYSAAALFDGYLDTVEEKLWESVKAMQETIFLLKEALGRAVAAGEGDDAKALQTTLSNLEERAEAVRALALKQPALTAGDAVVPRQQQDNPDSRR